MRSGGEALADGVMDDLAASRGANAGAVGLLMVAVAIPSSLTFHLGDTKFYAARLAIALLLFPALAALFGRGRRLVRCDALATLASAWMIGAILWAGRTEDLSSALAVVLEFWGGYVVARGFVFGRAAVSAFVNFLKGVVAVAVAAALLDHISGRLLLNSLIGPLVGVPLGWEPEYRSGLLRAMSIFPHPILFGAFCAASFAIFLYARERAFALLSLFGCVLAMSSAPMLVATIMMAVYAYDCVLQERPWRWSVFKGVLLTGFVVVFLVTEHPVSWIISHLTLDPTTGYFREATWDRAFYNIGLSPWTGYGFGDVGDPYAEEFFDNASVDAVWLVLALRFGIAVVPLLLLVNFSAFSGRPRLPSGSAHAASGVHTGFTMAIWVCMLTGLTVHYWNTMWLLWGVFLGIRAGMKEERATVPEQERSAAGYPFPFMPESGSPAAGRFGRQQARTWR